MQSTDLKNKEKADVINVYFLDKNSPSLIIDFKHFLLKHLGFGDFIFRNPIKLNNKIGEFYNIRGAIYYKIKRYDLALKDFLKKIELGIKCGDHYNVGNVYYMINDIKTAKRYYEIDAEYGHKSTCTIYLSITFSSKLPKPYISFFSLE